MLLWTSYCSFLILLVCGSLFEHGYRKAFIAKVALWSFACTLISTQIPKLIPQLDGSYTSNQSTDRKLLITSLIDKFIPSTLSKSDQKVISSTEEDETTGIDFTPTCGGGWDPKDNRLDIADLSKRDLLAQHKARC